jgi:hypothetical protein
MNPITLEVAGGSPNTLKVPREMRDYINERGEGRAFNIESFDIQQNDQPRQVVIDFRITKTGAEQLEPFTVSLVLGEAAARQMTEALNSTLGKSHE